MRTVFFAACGREQKAVERGLASLYVVSQGRGCPEDIASSKGPSDLVVADGSQSHGCNAAAL